MPTGKRQCILLVRVKVTYHQKVHDGVANLTEDWLAVPSGHQGAGVVTELGSHTQHQSEGEYLWEAASVMSYAAVCDVIIFFAIYNTYF